MLFSIFGYVVFASALVPNSADEACEPIRECNVVTHNSLISSPNIPVNRGNEVADKGHVEGVRPLEYNISLTFQNVTHYVGKVNISMFIVENTTQVLVNVNTRSMELPMGEIVIHRNCDQDSRIDVCIRSVTYVDSLKVLQLRLQSILLQNATYILSFNRFSSFAYDDKTGEGAEGLRRNLENSRTLVYTDFGMDKASTVFPCFDYPSLKAKFQLCIYHQRSLEIVVGNEVSLDDGYFIPDGMRTCHNSLIPLTTYGFGFAVMTGYDEVDKAPDQRCQLLSEDIVNKTINILERLTCTPRPFKPLDIILTRSAPNLDNDNAGFVMVDCDAMLDSKTKSAAFRNLYRSVVKQWTGVMATVDHFGLNCLSDSLTEYLVWLIEDELEVVDLAKNIDIARSYLPAYYPPLTSTDYYPEMYSPGRCPTIGPLIYNMLRQWSADEFEGFLWRLFKMGRHGSLSMKNWNYALSLGHDKKSRLSPDFFSGWFDVDGPVTLFIRNNRTSVSIRQETPNRQKTSRISIPVPTYLPINNHSVTYLINDTTWSLAMDEPQNWFLVDPYEVTPTNTVYDSTTYYNIFRDLYDQKSSLRNFDPLKLLRSFCYVLYQDLLPQAGDEDVNTWRDVFKYLYAMSPNCRCCLRPVLERSDCTEKENQRCDKLRLVRHIGYNRSKP